MPVKQVGISLSQSEARIVTSSPIRGEEADDHEALCHSLDMIACANIYHPPPQQARAHLVRGLQWTVVDTYHVCTVSCILLFINRLLFMQQSPRPTHWTDIPTHSITGNSPDLSSGMHWIYPFNDPMDNFANDLKLSGKRFTVNLNLKPHI